MKKLTAIFCALFLTPMFSAQAWIGGPFSNNTFFGEQGDDGVYEGIATGPNALGIFRIIVGNNFPGVTPESVTSSQPNFIAAPPGILVPRPGVSSGNVVLGALGRSENHLWFYEGVSYLGVSIGTVNSTLGQVAAIADAEALVGITSISSAFRGRLERSGGFLPATAFSGQGRAEVSNGERFRFTIFGSKVSSEILFGL